jgi:hypothetical protein
MLESEEGHPMTPKRSKSEPESKGRTRLTLYLSREMHLRLMRRALDESAAAGRRVSATSIVEELIAAYLRKGA